MGRILFFRLTFSHRAGSEMLRERRTNGVSLGCRSRNDIHCCSRNG